MPIVFKRKVESDLFVKVEISTTQKQEPTVLPPNTFTSSTNNSYQLNLERIQQQQQQQ